MVANGQLETPIATTEMQFEVGDIATVERFIVSASVANPLMRLLFLQNNSTVMDMRQSFLKLPVFFHAAQRCQQFEPKHY